MSSFILETMFFSVPKISLFLTTVELARHCNSHRECFDFLLIFFSLPFFSPLKTCYKFGTVLKLSYDACCFLPGTKARFLVCQPDDCNILATIFVERGCLEIPLVPPFFKIGENYFFNALTPNNIPGNVIVSSSFLVAGSCKDDGYGYEYDRKYLGN